MKPEALKTEIRSLIANDKLEEAIKILTDYFDGHEELDQIIIQSARYTSLKKEVALGAIAPSEATQELNVLRRNVLAFIREETAFLHSPKETFSAKDYEAMFALSWTRIAVAKLFMVSYQENTSLTISAIVKSAALKSRKLVVDFIKEMEALQFIVKEKINGETCWKLTREGVQFFKKFDSFLK